MHFIHSSLYLAHFMLFFFFFFAGEEQKEIIFLALQDFFMLFLLSFFASLLHLTYTYIMFQVLLKVLYIRQLTYSPTPLCYKWYYCFHVIYEGSDEQRS